MAPARPSLQNKKVARRSFVCKQERELTSSDINFSFQTNIMNKLNSSPDTYRDCV